MGSSVQRLCSSAPLGELCDGNSRHSRMRSESCELLALTGRTNSVSESTELALIDSP